MEKIQKILPIIGFITACLLLIVAVMNYTYLFKPKDLEIADISILEDKFDIVLKNPTDTDIFISRMDIQIIKKYDRISPTSIASGAGYKVTLTPTTRIVTTQLASGSDYAVIHPTQLASGSDYQVVTTQLASGSDYYRANYSLNSSSNSGLFALNDNEITGLQIYYVVDAKKYDRFTVDPCGCKCKQDNTIIGARLNVIFYYDNGKTTSKIIDYFCD